MKRIHTIKIAFFFLLNLYVCFSAFSMDSSWREEKGFRVVLTARHRTVLSSQVSSTVTEMNRKMGENFVKDERLIKFDDRVFASNKTKALAALEKAKVKLLATEELFKDKVASLLEIREAQLDVETAKSELVLAEQTLDACSIQAPYPGLIVTRYVDIHEMVQPGQRLLEIVDSRVLIGKILIPSHILKKVHIGQSLNVEIPEASQTVKGRISQIGAVIDPVSAMVKVNVEIDNEQDQLKPGMIGITQL